MKQELGNSSQFFDDLRSALNSEQQNDIEYLYDYTDEGDRRWNNLVNYLEFMKSEQPDILMIGEAPGYRGTSVSGVPFLSEQMILHRQHDNLKLPLNNYVQAKADGTSGYEATSTAMWLTLDQHPTRKLPLLWATLPNHPHSTDIKLSNRKPSKREIAPYLRIIDMLVAEYAIKRVVAIGNVAHDTLINCKYNDIIKIRHPARGGARKFADGYTHLIEEFYGKY